MVHWLLEIEIEGRAHSWSVEPVEVDDDHVYRGGLSEPEVEIGATDVRLVVTDGRIDWPSFAPVLQGARATLRRWLEGTQYAEALVMAAGVIRSVTWGARDEPISMEISSESSAVVGVPLPDVFARCGSLTWPIGGVTNLGDEGIPYPILFGYPGDEGGATPYCIMPVALAQWSATQLLTKMVISEDPDAPITTCQIRNQALDIEDTQDAERATDLLGRQVMTASFDASGNGYPSTPDESRQLWAGFSPAGGGGVVRAAYDVIVYLLRRWGQDTVEWDRISEVRDLLGVYMVDTWIDQTVDDPWTWLERVLLGDLPVRVRVGATGRRYFVPHLWRPADAQVIAELDTDRHLTAASLLSLEQPGPTNEFAAEFREDRASVYRARIVLTGGDGTDLGAVPTSAPSSTSTQSVTVARSGRCRDSRSLYGLRRAPLQVVDWTWDEGTVIRVLEDRAEREALPAIRAAYTVGDPYRHTLRENDVVRITDSDRGLEDRLATVCEPPLVGSERTTITLRIPR